MEVAAALRHFEDDPGMAGGAEHNQWNKIHGAILMIAIRKIHRSSIYREAAEKRQKDFYVDKTLSILHG
jgi:hypothetical protein